MVFEFWVPAVLIAVAGLSLLIDFGKKSPLEMRPVEPDPQPEDLATDLDPEEEAVTGAAMMPGYPLVAANNPGPPSQS